MSRKILNGWKEISNHIERGVRTAQRWEAFLGMPVHRPAQKNRSAVVAFTDELDRWIARALLGVPDADGDVGKEPLIRLHDNISSLARHTSELESQTKALQEQLRQSLAIHHHKMASRLRVRSIGVMLPFRPRSKSEHRLLFP